MKRKVLIALAIVLVSAFAGTALAAGYDMGSWTSKVCMYGFTANDPLTKTSSGIWDHFYPQPHYVRYANGEEYGWMNAYVKTPGGTRVSDICNCWALEDDNVYIYASADVYNTLRVRIENAEYPGEYNMESGGDFMAEWD